MKTILKLTEHLLIDLSTGECYDQEGYSNSQFRERLTSGQLKLLNYFVENRELLCSFSQLEGLFDDELGDYKMPGIKQQIWRIKQKLNNIDINFGADESKRVFQSVSGRGYIFHMPIHGRIYQRNAPSDFLWHITPEFCANLFLHNDEDKEKLRHQFFSGEADCKVTMQAVCNEMHFMNLQYRNILQSVMARIPKSDTIAPIMLMGDKGSGVSTLTCALGKYLSEEKTNWNVYYCDLSRIQFKGKQTLNEIFMYLDENHIGKVRKNVIIIDNPQDNAEIFEFIYSFFMYNNFENIHFVITGYKASLLPFLKDSSLLLNNIFPYAFYISNQERKRILSSSIQFQTLEYYDFPTEVKVQAVNGMADSYLIMKPIEKDIVTKILSDLEYEVKNIKELFLEFVYQYNSILFERGISQKCIYIPNMEMEWSEWEVKCETLDADCNKILLSELFPYIAVLNILDIPVTFELVRKMTGYSYQNRLLRLFYKKNGNIWFENGEFIFRNESIPFIFFSMFPEYKPLFFIQELIAHDYMDCSTLLLFIKHVIWYPLKCYKDTSWHPYVEKLIEMLQKNGAYQRICNDYLKDNNLKNLTDVWEQESRPVIDYVHALKFFHYCQSQ